MEDRIQEKVIERLMELNILPFSVVFTYALPQYHDGALCITFFLGSDLNEFLESTGYNMMCDKSGYTIFRETNTLFLTGIALFSYFYG